MRRIGNRADKQRFLIYINRTVFRTLKAYGAENDKSLFEILKVPLDVFEQEATRIAGEVELMRTKALQKRLKQQEEQKLADEHPIKVSGHKEDPIADRSF